MSAYEHAPLTAGTFQVEGELPFGDVEGRIRRVYLCEEDGLWKVQMLFARDLTGYEVNVHRVEHVRIRCPHGGPSKRLMGIPWP